MKVSFTRYENFFQYWRMFLEFVLWTRLAQVIVFITLGIGFTYIPSIMLPWYVSITIVMSILLFLLPFLKYQRMKRKGLHKQEVIYQFSNDALLILSNRESNRLNWDSFTKILRSPHYFLLQRTFRKGTVIIPREVIGNEKDFTHRINRYIGGAKEKAKKE